MLELDSLDLARNIPVICSRLGLDWVDPFSTSFGCPLGGCPVFFWLYLTFNFGNKSSIEHFCRIIIEPKLNWVTKGFCHEANQMIEIDKACASLSVKERMSYPFVQMEVGDSFLLTEYKKAESARVAALLFAKRKSLEWKFSLRKVNEGWRVIRVH